MKEMNELEQFIELTIKMIENRANDNPKGGVKIDSTCKMKYTDMLKSAQKLKSFLYDKSAIRYYSICQMCENYKADTDCGGLCESKNRDIAPRVHPYHTCFRNTDTRFINKNWEYPDYPSERGECR